MSSLKLKKFLDLKLLKEKTQHHYLIMRVKTKKLITKKKRNFILQKIKQYRK